MDKWKIRKIRKEVKQYDDGSALSFLELLDLLEYDILHFHEKDLQYRKSEKEGYEWNFQRL